jgi:hypothetical protein
MNFRHCSAAKIAATSADAIAGDREMGVRLRAILGEVTGDGPCVVHPDDGTAPKAGTLPFTVVSAST